MKTVFLHFLLPQIASRMETVPLTRSGLQYTTRTITQCHTRWILRAGGHTLASWMTRAMRLGEGAYFVSRSFRVLNYFKFKSR